MLAKNTHKYLHTLKMKTQMKFV